MMTWLFIYILAISLYDLRTCRIPNGYTIPIFLAGMIMHFPGSLDLWLASFLLLSVWANHWMGAGDVKLWLALLWAMPGEFSAQVILFMFISFFLTSLIQILWRIIKEQEPTRKLSPAAWRTIPFILLCWYVH
ncbi:MAG: prepilin peptidase [Chloroflexi bacterium]|nr:prepilin peptidase [Chloroflexota bacterium]